MKFLPLYLCRFFLVPVLLLLSHFARGQEDTDTSLYSNKRTKFLPLPHYGDTLILDSFSIVPHSLSIPHISPSDYLVLPFEGKLVWLSHLRSKLINEKLTLDLRNDSIISSLSPIASFIKQWINLSDTGHAAKPSELSPIDTTLADTFIVMNYRTLPFHFLKPYQNKPYQKIDSLYVFKPYRANEANTINQSFVDFDAIDYHGSYSRSMSLGNAQDVNLNSNFNLQLNGYILDSIRIEAAITDNNIPFQPEGNTQQLQEFDQMYITFEKKKHKLTAGDYTLEKPNSYFLQFNKRVMGLYYQGESKISDNITTQNSFSGSIAKGAYARNVFTATEGNQGPYKLTGNNGEQYLIILANTERVFIDGVLMQRGEDRDYIIDYNLGEVRFMPRQLITKDKRIQIEFEYQDRNYLNSLFYFTNNTQWGKKLQTQINFYSNQDAKNQSYNQSLNAEQKQFLAQIGNRIDDAYYKVYTPDTFTSSKILYRVLDTLLNGVYYDSVFEYSSDLAQTLYSVSFSYVGEGKGDYILSDFNTNGRSYVWVPPIDGIQQGNFAPLALLITPKMHQMLTVSGQYQIDSLKNINLELAGSNYDPNLFSDLDSRLNTGWAGKFNYNEKRIFPPKNQDSAQTKKAIEWENKVNYEFVHHQFKAIAPYRNIEFGRDWNITADTLTYNEHIIDIASQVQQQDLGNINYQLTYYQRGEAYTGWRNKAGINYLRSTFKTGVLFNIMQSNATFQRSSFLRPSIYIEKTITGLNNTLIGAKYDIEHNTVTNKQNDSLHPLSFYFDVAQLYIQNQTNEKTQFQLTYTYRNDRLPYENIFRQQSEGHTIDGNVNFNHIKDQSIKLTGGFRQLNLPQETNETQKKSTTLLGRLEYTGSIFNRVLTPTILYEIGSGQEQKMQFTFVEVPIGQGMYMWVDYNEDGVQQVNEFELAIYPDQKRFIKVWTPTNDYIKVNYLIFNPFLLVNPEYFWPEAKERKKWQKLISRFSGQFSMQMHNRALGEAGLKTYNPFFSNIEDEHIIANTTSINSTLFFNRSSSKWGTEYTFSQQGTKSILTYGLEGQNTYRHSLNTRINLLNQFTLQTRASTGKRQYNSALADGRTYLIDMQSVEPSLTWIYKSKLRFTGSYNYQQRENDALFGGEKAIFHNVNFDSRISFDFSGIINLKISYTHINYNAPPNTSIAYNMLDALQNGSNWLWNINWERRIGSGLEISLQYEGRKPGNQNIIHTGTMSIKALL